MTKQYPATLILLASIFLVFIVELATGAIGNDARLLALGAISDSAGIGKEYWRLLTYAWLHAGYFHLTMNCLLLWFVGRLVERRISSWQMLLVYIACALAGGVSIVLRVSEHPKPGVSLGASAAVSGLLTCALVLVYRVGGKQFPQPGWLPAMLWAILVVDLAVSFLPGVSLVGHLGGLVLGGLLGLLVRYRPVNEVV